jgi:hypothetical protein
MVVSIYTLCRILSAIVANPENGKAAERLADKLRAAKTTVSFSGSLGASLRIAMFHGFLGLSLKDQVFWRFSHSHHISNNLYNRVKMGEVRS